MGGEVGAFVLALREGASHDSVNYRWFIERDERFLYVDRVVVSRALHGCGLGRVLYESVFTHAKATRVPVVTCEYDIEPPNLASERFHRAFGFVEVGRQLVAGGKERVPLHTAAAPSRRVQLGSNAGLQKQPLAYDRPLVHIPKKA